MFVFSQLIAIFAIWLYCLLSNSLVPFAIKDLGFLERDFGNDLLRSPTTCFLSFYPVADLVLQNCGQSYTCPRICTSHVADTPNKFFLVGNFPLLALFFGILINDCKQEPNL